MKRSLYLGATRPIDGRPLVSPMLLPAHHLTTHSVVLGMTGSGKTGLVTVLVEEALRASIPVLVIDVKGDLPNLLLSFPTFDPGAVAPWVEGSPNEQENVDEASRRLAAERERGLAAFSIGVPELTRYVSSTHVRVITPGADAGELLHVLSSLERRSGRWDTDVDGARAALSAAISLILRLLGRDADPARSREHVLLSVIAEHRLKAGLTAEIGALLPEIVEPPFETIGALEVDEFMSKRARRELAAALNAILASPSFASWRQGATLDVGEWMKPVDGKTPATVLSVAHLDDDERALVLGVVLEEVLTWVRGLPGSQQLRALIVLELHARIVVPAPVVDELRRQAVEESAELIASIAGSARRLRRLVTGGWLAPPPVTLEADVKKQLIHAFGQYADRVGALVAPYPVVSHQELARRAVERVRPFQEQGRGYTDALIWHAILERLAAHDEPVVFVSGNSKDYRARGRWLR